MLPVLAQRLCQSLPCSSCPRSAAHMRHDMQPWFRMTAHTLLTGRIQLPMMPSSMKHQTAQLQPCPGQASTHHIEAAPHPAASMRHDAQPCLQDGSHCRNIGAMPQQAAVVQGGVSLKSLPLPLALHAPQVQELQAAGGGLHAKGTWAPSLAVASGLSLPLAVNRLSTCWVLVVACGHKGPVHEWHAC